MTETETSVRAIVRATFRDALEGFGPEVAEEVLAKVDEVPYDNDRDAYLKAVRAVVMSVLQARIAAQDAETKALRRQTDESEAKTKQWLKALEELDKPNNIIH